MRESGGTGTPVDDSGTRVGGRGAFGFSDDEPARGVPDDEAAGAADARGVFCIGVNGFVGLIVRPREEVCGVDGPACWCSEDGVAGKCEELPPLPERFWLISVATAAWKAGVLFPCRAPSALICS